MTGVIVRVFKPTEDWPHSVDVSVFPDGKTRMENPTQVSYEARQMVASETSFQPISQLLTIRKLEARGWKLRSSNAWEEAEA